MIKKFQGINGANLIYIKCNHPHYANKKTMIHPKHITKVSYKHYILF